MHHVEPLTLSSALSGWTFAYGWDLLILLVAITYGTGLVRLRRRAPHRPWPVHRSVLLAATDSGDDRRHGRPPAPRGDARLPMMRQRRSVVTAHSTPAVRAGPAAMAANTAYMLAAM